MSTPLIHRRTVLAAGAATAALSVPGVAAEASSRSRTTVGFTLNAEVLDGGEQVTSLTLRTSRLGRLDPDSLTRGTFTVRVKATSPIPVSASDAATAEYELDRRVTKARVHRNGDVVLELASGEGVAGAGTLGYLVSKGRNVQLDLVYTITQTAPLRRRDGRRVTIARFEQGRLSSPEVDAFDYGRVAGGLKYRLFTPPVGRGRGRRGRRERRPLVVWLHGGGEGGLLPDGYYDNETTLRANRGALGFATAEAQRIFDGAYVVAPQSTSFWIEDGPRFAPQILDVIEQVARHHRIDRDRIHVVGCSNGGYMTLELTATYRSRFASSVPICGVVQPFRTSAERLVTDDELRSITTPTWLVASRDDATVDPVANTVLASRLIPGARLSLYETVTWNGYRFPGHWSWIYVARNDPKIHGQRIWSWMAAQSR